MKDYIIKQIKTNEGTYKWDYNSLVNLPDLSKTVQAGTGLEIEETGPGTVKLGLSEKLSGILEGLTGKVFPLEATLTRSTGLGLARRGTQVRPEIEWTLTHRQAVPERTLVLAQVKSSTGDWVTVGTYREVTTVRFPVITKDTELRIHITDLSDSSTTVLGPFEVSFVYPSYFGRLATEPTEVTEEFLKGKLQETLIATATFPSTNLEKGQYFLFAAPGNTSLVVRQTETGGVVDSDRGTLTMNQGSIEVMYSWVLVPKSGISWNFKITDV